MTSAGGRSNDRRTSLPVLLLTGFEPFAKERINPSWQIAQRLDGRSVGGFRIKAVRLPVIFSRATRAMSSAITRYRPAAVLSLGQAGGRPSISVEQVAINLVDGRARDNSGRRSGKRQLARAGPDAYFARLPIERIVDTLKRKRIPAERSLSAGAFICNAAMYTALHQLRNRRNVPAGFIHLPYETAQAARRSERPSMSLELMERAVRLTIETLAEKNSGRTA